MPNNKTTHFGFETVLEDEKVQKVAEVFHSVAQKYDVMNDVMSCGMHRLWKRFTIDKSSVRRGDHVLDLAGGTGDLAKAWAAIVGQEGRVILSDINPSMLNVARDRFLDEGIVGNVEFVEANAESLPFPDESVDVVSIAFGLRNVTNKDKALAEMYRVLKPNGRALILEFSKPTSAELSKWYDRYSFNLIPKLGKWIANDEASYRYLVESIRMHPDQESLKNMMNAAGFTEVKYDNLTGGIVALHRGFKS